MTYKDRIGRDAFCQMVSNYSGISTKLKMLLRLETNRGYIKQNRRTLRSFELPREFSRAQTGKNGQSRVD